MGDVAMARDAGAEALTSRKSATESLPRGVVWGFGAGLLYLFAFVLFAKLDILLCLVADDASYYFRIGENLALGYGSSFDRITVTNGCQPLWILLITAGHWLVRGEPEIMVRVFLITQVFLLAGAALLLDRILRELFAAPLRALAGILFVYLVMMRSLNGMESSLLQFTLALAFHEAWRRRTFTRDAHGPALVMGILLGLLVLARLDMVLLVLVLFGIAFLRVLVHRRRTALFALLVMGGGFLVLVAPYLIMNLAQFGHLMPISGALKSSFPQPRLSASALAALSKREWIYLPAALAALAGMALPAWRRAGGELSRLRYRRALAVMAAGAWLHYLHSALFMQWAVWYWHYAFYAPLFILILLEGLRVIAARRRWPGGRRLAWALVTLVLAGAGLKVWQHTFVLRYDGNWKVNSYHAALWAREHTPPAAVFAMKDAGVFGYFSRRSTMNLDGLVNDFNYHEVIADRRLGEHLREKGVGYLVTPTLKERGDVNCRLVPEGVTGSIVAGEYASLGFSFLSHLNGAYSDTLRVRREDEVYASRGRPGPVIAIWRLMP